MLTSSRVRSLQDEGLLSLVTIETREVDCRSALEGQSGSARQAVRHGEKGLCCECLGSHKAGDIGAFY